MIPIFTLLEGSVFQGRDGIKENHGFGIGLKSFSKPLTGFTLDQQRLPVRLVSLMNCTRECYPYDILDGTIFY